MSVDDLRRYLHTEIPLTVAMGVEVRQAGRERVVLTAPLAPNINHQKTAFGGSVAAIATLAAWSVLFIRCREIPTPTDLVVQRSELEYLRPIRGELLASCDFSDESAWQTARRRLEVRGRARLELESRLETTEEVAARFCGRFALLRSD